MATPGRWAPDVGSHHPATATLTAFALLTATILLAGVFVGQWLAMGEPAGTSLHWMVAVPLVILVATAGLVAAQPGRRVRSDDLVPVPPQSPGARRHADVAAQAGLVPAPELVWNPQDPRTGALALGRPGRYLVRVTPALLGTARRRPATYDAVVRHELAHVRHHDVALAYLALYSWYATLPVLAVPVVLRLAGGDRSLLPSYLVRAVALASAVYLARAFLLRRREHEADLRAAMWSGDPHGVAAVFGRVPGPPGHRLLRKRRLLALHPTGPERVAYVLDPGRRARLSPATLLVAGFAAGAALPLLQALAAEAFAWDALTAARAARAVSFGGLGAVVGAEVWRTGSVGRPVNGPGRTAATGAALAAGVAVGALLSLGGTGLVQGSAVDAVAAGLTGLLLGAVLVVGRELAAGPPRAVALGAAVACALAADAVTGVAELVAGGLSVFVLAFLPFVAAQSPAAWLLGLAVVAVATGALVRDRRTDHHRRLATAAVAGLVGAAAAVVAGAVADELGLGGLIWAPVGAALAVLVVVGVRGLADGVLAGAVTVVLAAPAGVVVAAVRAGGPLGTDGVWAVLEPAAATVTLAGLPLLAGVGVLRRPGAPREAGRLVLVTTVVALVSAVTTAVLAPADSPAPSDAGALGAYLSEELPLLVVLRDTAAVAYEEALYFPRGGDVAADLRGRVVGLYDDAIDAADDVEAGFPLGGAPELRQLHEAYRDVVVAERALTLAAAQAQVDPAATAQAQTAATAAAAAMARWTELHEAALGTLGEAGR
ncbi:M48 family metalloprotease [Georgenia sp. M64]|uniref:M48 family metalloprotease n=1 Tax=Georgenia sp. M64 TaxID=3120520 RepID=UPI0030E2AF08